MLLLLFVFSGLVFLWGIVKHINMFMYIIIINPNGRPVK
jgi:hypothetical protein